MTKTRIQYIKEAAKKLVDSKLQRGKHFQKQPQEDRISGIKNRQPSIPTFHMPEWRVVIFPLPCKESYGIPYINFAFINCGTFHAIFISFVNVTGLKP